MFRDKKPYNILVVEDNPGDFAIVDDFLREQILNPIIVQAINYKQVLSTLSESVIVFDVILLDLSLPDKSGQNLISEMLTIANSCPIIVLTGYSDIEFSIKSISQGIYDYLLKDDLSAIALYKSIIYAIERKKTFSALQNSEKRANDLFNLSPQPMLIFDMETYQFTKVNQAAITHYGFSNEEFLNKTILCIVREEDILKTKKKIEAHKSTENSVFNGKTIHRKKSGDLIDVELFCSPITINERNYISVIAIDVTEKNIFEKKLMKAIIKTQEDERYEIGGELHDNICQLVAANQLSLNMLKGAVAIEKIPFFEQSKANLSLILEEIRNLSHRLAPALFENSTLEEAFHRLFNNFDPEGQFEILFYINDNVNNYPLSHELKVNLYRIMQEQLRNIQKYAQAKLIEIDVLIYKNNLKMRISDNGDGFDIKTVKNGIGLANMKRRTELFSGNFQIESTAGEGCTVLIDIPLPKINEIDGVDGLNA